MPENVWYCKNYLQVAPGPKRVLTLPEVLIFFQRILATARIENFSYPRSTESYLTVFSRLR